MAIKDAVATVMSRNAFYRDGYRFLLRISLIQGAVIVLLVAGLIGLIVTVKTQQVYFATTSDGRIIQIWPLSDSYRSQADVIAWAAGNAQNVMRFGYNDYHQRLDQARSKFTTAGWENFSKALRESSIIESIEARKLVVSMDIDGAPEITNQGVRDGVYVWNVQFPVTIKYDGNEPPASSSSRLRLQIVRVSTLENPDGIAIGQWVQLDGKR